MKNILLGIVALVAVVAIAGGYYFPQFAVPSGSTAGATFNSAKYAGIVVNLASPGANATSSSILNTDASARYVTGYRIGCSGVGSSKTAYTGTGLANLTLTIGTSSTAAPATLSPTFPVANAAVVATTSVNMASASSTTATNGMGNASLWGAGEYMSFAFNATNTAACTVGVDYIGS